ncbi:MAG: helix-turn-helix transcriptional regulator [Spongiibacteraceae bacterium]
MQQLFVSDTRCLRKNWKTAFTDDAILLPPKANGGLSSSVIYWLDWSAVGPTVGKSLLDALLSTSAKVVVMNAKPDAEEAMQLFSIGVRGYCHQHAAPEQLREIALVIEHGGVWLGAEAMSRLIRGTLNVFQSNAIQQPTLEPHMETLTTKEQSVALEVSRGASNKEIATALNIGERTVKTHLSALFSKLDVRDRVQLALKLNNISIK